MRSLEVVSFDVDGTLYDLRAMKRAVTWAAVQRAYRPSTLRELSALGRFHREIELLRSQGASFTPGRIHADRERLLELERRWYAPAIARVGVHELVAPVLQAARAQGLRCVVVSDFVAQHKLVALGLERAFSALFAGEELGHIKPSPGLFTAVASKLGVPPERILHIGDRPECDGLAARAAGCQVRLIQEGKAHMLAALHRD